MIPKRITDASLYSYTLIEYGLSETPLETPCVSQRAARLRGNARMENIRADAPEQAGWITHYEVIRHTRADGNRKVVETRSAFRPERGS